MLISLYLVRGNIVNSIYFFPCPWGYFKFITIFFLSNLLGFETDIFFSISFLNGFRGFEKNISSLGCCLIWHNRIQFYCLKQVKTLKIKFYIQIKMLPFLFVLLYMRRLFWNISPYFFYPCFLRFWCFNSKLYLFYISVQNFCKKNSELLKMSKEKERNMFVLHILAK